MGGPVCVDHTVCMSCRRDINCQAAGNGETGNPKHFDAALSHPKSLRESTPLTLIHRNGDDYYCEKDLLVQLETKCVLTHGCFYYPEADSTEAKLLLKPCSVGTFLIRDSSDSKYLYTISVKTRRGPTSIRVFYEHGRFSLDSDERSKSHMPRFQSLLQLLDFYIRKSRGKKSEQCRFLDKTGKKDLPIVMLKPKEHDVPSLKHLTRTLITRSLPATSSSEVPSQVEKLPLPKPLKSYLKDYPYLF